MAWDWKGVVGSVAPAIATALGGPFAGMAVGALGKALGIGEDASETDVAAALRNPTQEQLLEIQKANLEFEQRMAELHVDLERIAAGDRDSARKREIYTGDVWTSRILAIILVGLFTVCSWYICFKVLPPMGEAQMGLVGTVIGFISAKTSTVVEYYFGSSAHQMSSMGNKKR